ncbi:MAG: hypothetical protein ACR2LI_03265 [Propionibacteriaceae bacterium]
MSTTRRGWVIAAWVLRVRVGIVAFTETSNSQPIIAIRCGVVLLLV